MLSAGKEIQRYARKDAVDKVHKRKCRLRMVKLCKGTVTNITIWLAVQFEWTSDADTAKLQKVTRYIVRFVQMFDAGT